MSEKSLSPDGTLGLELFGASAPSGGTGGHGHDADDYFTHDVSAFVRDLATGAIVLFKKWEEHYDADTQTSIGQRPSSVAFSADGRALVATFRDGSQETLPIPRGGR